MFARPYPASQTCRLNTSIPNAPLLNISLTVAGAGPGTGYGLSLLLGIIPPCILSVVPLFPVSHTESRFYWGVAYGSVAVQAPGNFTVLVPRLVLDPVTLMFAHLIFLIGMRWKLIWGMQHKFYVEANSEAKGGAAFCFAGRSPTSGSIVLEKVALVPGYLTNLVSLDLLSQRGIHWSFKTPRLLRDMVTCKLI